MNTSFGKEGHSHHTVTTYQQARLQQADFLRKNVVEAAANLLQESAPETVTIRRIAEQMECSTKIIYNLFGSKGGLAKQLFLEGCQRLSQSFQAVDQTDPPHSLRDLADAYWYFAQSHRSFYKLMFGGAFIEFKPDEESYLGTITALKQVLDVVGEAMNQGLILASDSLLVVRMIWAPLHGVIDLYFGGHIGSQSEAKLLYDRVSKAVIESLFVSGD